MTNGTELLNRWLGDAHALRLEIAGLLAAATERMRNFPELQNRFDLHLPDTMDQCRRLESALSHRTPDRLPKAPAATAALRRARAMTLDEILAFTVDLYAATHRAIAVSRVLLMAAEQAGDEAAQRLCREMLWQDDAMAASLRMSLPQIARDRLGEGERAGNRRRLRAPLQGRFLPQGARPTH